MLILHDHDGYWTAQNVADAAVRVAQSLTQRRAEPLDHLSDVELLRAEGCHWYEYDADEWRLVTDYDTWLEGWDPNGFVDPVEFANGDPLRRLWDVLSTTR